MLEILIWSVFTGTLGIEALMVSGWMRRQQLWEAWLFQEEDDILTRYESLESLEAGSEPVNGGSPQPLPKDPRLTGWEYKIVRANIDLFRDPAVFQNLCNEESQAGWILLEKLDDRRVRFKRPIAMREVVQTEFLSFDPYRTHYGPNVSWKTWVGGVAALAAMALPAYLGYVLVANTLATSQRPVPGNSPAISIPNSGDLENSTTP
jgi:hypothetical protein